MKPPGLIALLLILAFFAACGAGNDSNNSDSAPSSTGSISLSGNSGSFDIPGGVSSVTLYANGEMNADNLTISVMDGPDDSGYVGTYRVAVDGPYGLAVARTIPDADYTPVTEGRWRYKINCFGCLVPEIKAFWKSGEGVNMKLNVILVSQSDITSADDPNLQETLGRFKSIFASNGINISEITYKWIESDDTVITSTDTNGNFQPDGMDRLFSGNKGNSDFVQLFFVQSAGPGGTLGIAGGIPGPPVAGTAHSGVIAATFGGLSTLSSHDKNLLGETIAHEIGHYLGLYHTSESNGLRFDPVSDTGECRKSNPIPASCPDGANLMFFAAGGPSIPQTTLSPGQRFVLRHAHLVR
ncbi:hypothetical protein MNBD_NITROSPINAE02-2207 [hydrothermal vent metagenome]|uniref:Peptidase M43 pregnancy-associated plasma-A domain-containing protein n=1 Tax=hydrothermal vent metagenome TaxID=652676 RepID=A0A3B1C1B7_9ZZZZ